jgi:anti-sigma regulatory factor (Ser/Thr protein kinase)
VTNVATPSVGRTRGALDPRESPQRSTPSIVALEGPDPLAIRLAGGHDAAHRARELLAAHLTEIPALPDPAAFELLLCELVNNAVLHGGAGRSDAVWLRVSRSAGRIRLEVRDAGPGFVAQPFARPPGEAGGFGLRLVDRLADAWGYSRERGLTSVWFELATR